MDDTQAKEWRRVADQLDATSEDLLRLAPSAPDDMEGQLIELQALSLRHLAIRLRSLAD